MDTEEILLNEKPHIDDEFHYQEHIALAELEAVLFAIEKISRDVGGNQHLPDVWMIAIDSMAARGMLGRGFSKVDEARELLKKIDALIGDKCIFLHWVKSADNPADAPSRDKESWNEKQQQLWFNLKSKMKSLLPTALTCVENGKSTVVLPKSKDQQEKTEVTNQGTVLKKTVVTNQGAVFEDEAEKITKTSAEKESGIRRDRDQ